MSTSRPLYEKSVELVENKPDSTFTNINKTHDKMLVKQTSLMGNEKQIKKKNKNSEARVFYINEVSKNKNKFKYPNNFVTTSLYTWWDFFPKSLLLQFKRYANIYFLMITTLQCVPIISPLNPITAAGPFILVLMISVIREGMEDLERHRQDEKENTEKVMRFDISKNRYIEDLAKNLEVGEIIKINEYTIIPADCILLTSSNTNKIAYIETANLDGEKDLKPKNSIPQIFKIMKEADEILRIRGKIICNKPDSDLHKFNGKIELNKNQSYSINTKQLLYKGTILKNTNWAIGLVVYTGKHSKIVLNSQKGEPKQSHLEKFVNQLIGIIFLLQIVFCLILAVCNTAWFYHNKDLHAYIGFNIDYLIQNSAISGLVSFFSYLLLHNTMIPISLIVSMEVVKYSQAYFMDVDVDMYSSVKDKYAKCNTCSLNEELGQIKYIFSDKTGTLTANKLEFKACAIGEEIFGITQNELVESEGNLLKLDRKVSKYFGGVGMILQYAFPEEVLKEYTIKGNTGKPYDIKLYSKNKQSHINFKFSQDIIFHYFYCLSLNQFCMVEQKLKKGKMEKHIKMKRPTKKFIVSPGKNILNAVNDLESNNDLGARKKIMLSENFNDYDISYRGSNPDEIIFVDFARNMGFTYLGGDETVANLKLQKDINGNSSSFEDQKFDILKVLEFTSTRGMMSVVVKRDSDGDNKIILYSKGGDKKINALLDNNYQPFLPSIKEKAIKLAEMGLRVLWIAMKVIDLKEFNEWDKDYEDGLKQLVDEEKILKYKVEKYVKLEDGLTLIGCTAVEDKLQDKVPETIKQLQTAGINVWVLTGDNLPTAKNIGLMCNLLPKNMDVYELNDDIEKFKQKVLEIVLNKSNIFSIQNIKNAKNLIINYEKALGTYESEVIIHNDDSNEIGRDDKKAIIYVGLQEMLIKYKESELRNKSVLRGILVESEILRMVLPADNLKDIKYYGHPLTKLFLDLTLDSQAVICCRVAPKQKALVVRMIKSNIQGAITLSVGDGANDVSMILEADVGVGIFGEEGTQAAMSSDYAIGEFKCLRKLILIHGRTNYIRIAEMILYFFFKNFLFTIPQFYYAFYAAFSGESLYDEWFVSLYNVVFTAWPLMLKAMLDQDINDNDGEFIKENIPYTYYQGREGTIFNINSFVRTILGAVVESIIVFFFTQYMMFYTIPQNSQGHVADFWSNSLTQFTSIIFIVNYRLLVFQRFHTWINISFILITSYGSYVSYFFFSSFFLFSKSVGTLDSLFTFPQFYLVVFITSSICLLYDLAKNFIIINFIDEPATLLRRYLKDNKSLTNNNIHQLNRKIKSKIVEYDENVRNIYKVQRIPIPDIISPNVNNSHIYIQ